MLSDSNFPNRMQIIQYLTLVLEKIFKLMQQAENFYQFNTSKVLASIYS